MLKRLGACLILAALAWVPAYADTEVTNPPEQPSAPAARTVEAIIIQFKGVSAVSESVTRSHIELKEGGPFSQAALDRSIKALFATGFYENVYATPNEAAGGRVSVNFELTPKPKIRTINWEGNRRMKPKALAKESGLKAGDMLGAQDLALAINKLKAAYAKKNYPDVKIVGRTTALAQGGLVDLTLVIDEGQKVKVEKINFVGNRSVKAKELKEAMATKEDGLLSFITGSGKVDDELQMDDLTRIGELYRNRGYLEVKVTGPAITPRGSGVALTYTIDEGPRYRVGAQRVEGNTLFPAQAFAKSYRLKTGAPYAPAAVEASANAIREVYGAKGYLQTQVRAQMQATPQPQVLDIVYSVKESPQFTVSTVNIAGNTTTKNVVIARELLLAPGDVFSSTKMKTSEERLKNTAYFGDVKITDEPSATEPDGHEMNVTVTEGKTGKISAGVGFSALDKGNIFAELSQGNFDITNPKNMFRGGGQKMRIFLSLAQESNQAILNFEEPWLFQRRLAGGFSLYRTETDYVSSKYNERRTGFEVYLRKRLVELIDGRLGYRRENVEIFDVSSDASSAIQAEAGERSVSKLTMTFTRDTRDKILFTTRGNRLELDTAWAGNGLGGDTEYWMVEGRAAQYFRGFSWPTPQTIILLARAGTMDGFNNGQVPLFDKFFLGGPSSLRGFGYRKVGPADASGEPLGGKTYGFWSFEYAFQVAPILQFATFYDAGFVNSGTSDFDAADYNDNWGVGLRLMIMGAPLRMDYGIPISSSTHNDNSGRFWFSFGTRF